MTLKNWQNILCGKKGGKMAKRKYIAKTKKEQVMSTQQPTEMLTENQLYDVLRFAETYYSFASKTSSTKFDDFMGAYTPYLTNQRLGEIALTPQNLSSEALARAFSAPIDNQETLNGYSEFLVLTDSVAKRSRGYIGNLPAFDYTFYCTNIKDISEYDSEEYKRDYEIVKTFLSKFDVRGQFSYINRRMFDIDAFYGIFRMEGDHYVFQELPYQYCKITGRNADWGFQFDMDMNWFLKMGLSFDQYPPIFKKLFDNVMSAKYGDKYDPGEPLNKRKGTFALWTQTSSLPNKGNFVCFKMNHDGYSSVPFLSALFQDAINKPLLRALQTDQYIIASQKILIGLIPLLKDQKSGQVKDALAVSPNVLGQFLGLLKQGLSNAIKITGAPFADVKQVEYELPDKNMYNEVNTIEAANSGVTSRVLYSSDRMSATEVEYSVDIDAMIANSVYPPLATWLSSQINFFTKKYKFKFVFEGTNFSSNREKRQKTAQEFANMGFLNEQKIAAAWGMDIFQLQAQMEMGKTSKLDSLLRLPPNAHTASLGSADSGRPKVDIPSDSTERSLDRD